MNLIHKKNEIEARGLTEPCKTQFSLRLSQKAVVKESYVQRLLINPPHKIFIKVDIRNEYKNTYNTLLTFYSLFAFTLREMEVFMYTCRHTNHSMT